MNTSTFPISGFVYLIQEAESDNYKIGYSTRVLDRLSDLQNGNAHKLVLKHQFFSKNAPFLERCVHSHYSTCRMNGEWFKIPQSEVNRFLSVCAEQEEKCVVSLSCETLRSYPGYVNEFCLMTRISGEVRQYSCNNGTNSITGCVRIDGYGTYPTDLCSSDFPFRAYDKGNGELLHIIQPGKLVIINGFMRAETIKKNGKTVNRTVLHITDARIP